MKGIRLLLKNAFRSAGKSLYQIFGLSALILLVSLIFSLILQTSSSVFNATSDLNKNSNLRDYVVVIDSSKINIGKTDDNKDYLSNVNYTTAQEVYQEEILNDVLKINDGNASWTRTEGRTFSGVKNNGKNLTIKALAKYSDKKTMRQDDASVDKLVITSGKNISEDKTLAAHQIVLQKTFAEKNNVKIGDVVRFSVDSFSLNYGDELLVTRDSEIKNNLNSELNGKSWSENYAATEYSTANWFEVVGLGVSDDFVAPIIDQTTTLPNVYTNLIVYADPSTFGFVNGDSYDYVASKASLFLASDNDREVYYSIKTSKLFNINSFTTMLKSAYGLNTDDKFIYANDDADYLYYQRVNMFSTVANIFNIISFVLLLTVALIAGITVVLMTKKYVDSIQKQIGCLKALGYKKREIVNNFVALPLITSALGSIVGYSLSIGVGQGVLFGFTQYFNVDFGGIHFEISSFLTSIFGTFLVMLIIALATSYTTIKRSPLNLLKGDADKQSSFFSRQLKKMTLSKSFDGKLRGALMASSAGKLFAVSGTMLLSTILMSATAVAPKIMADNQTKSFDGINYKNSVEYTTPLWNNPFSFMRTYNPIVENNVKGSGWGVYNYDSDGVQHLKPKLKNLSVDMEKADGKATGVSNLPYLNTAQSGGDYFKSIDYDKVLNALFNNELPTSYYSYNLTTSYSDFFAGTGGAWANMAYLAWTTLPMDYLKAINKEVDNSTGVGGMTVKTLEAQWPDYKILTDAINSASDSRSLCENLLWFYKKYTSGPKLDYISKIDANTKTKLNPNNAAQNGYDDFEHSNGKSFKKEGDGEDADAQKLSVERMNDSEVKYVNGEIINWFDHTIKDRLGVVLLETAYSRSPYFVQQKMLKAYNTGSNYTLAFNVVPYNEKTDDLGTMLNVVAKSRNENELSFKVYGVSENIKTVNLGKNKNRLFNAEETESIPMILNKTAIKKLGINVGDSINMSYLFSELQKDGVESKYDWDNSKIDNAETSIKISSNLRDDKSFISNSDLTYYSKNKSYIRTTGISPNKVAGSEIATSTSLASTGANDALKKATSGQVKIAQNYKNMSVKIVGIQDSYGKASGWISNDNANHLLNYDEEQKYVYERLFLPQFLGYFSDLGNKAKNANNNELSFLFGDTLSNESFSTYNNLLQTCNKSGDMQSEGQKILRLFNNMYPIYNYKNSLDETNYDLDQVLSNDQRFGDFSAIGLNGGNDGGVAYTGFGQGSYGLIYPVTTARQILEQITGIVDMVIILFIVIAFVVSLTMILLITSIIIRENIQFIATMKILGYSDKYIIKQILGMYIPGLILSFALGFILSWFGIAYLGDLLATNSTWVLPIQFYIWYPFAVFALLATVFVISSAIGYTAVKRVHPLVALQYEK